jgi:hypothetical protein
LTTIRPNVFPQQPQVGGQRDEPGRLAAQRAFFAAVSGQTQAPAAPTVATAAAEPSQAVNRSTQVSPTDAPQKVLRPGSLLDIRV